MTLVRLISYLVSYRKSLKILTFPETSTRQVGEVKRLVLESRVSVVCRLDPDWEFRGLRIRT